MIRGFCDESYDKDHRVYSLAGFVGRDKQWNKIAKRWRNRCLDDGIRCYHAADCEGGYGDFKDFSKEQIASLNTDLISILTEEQGIVGVGISIDLAEHRLASESSDKARRILGNHPYFMVMECLVSEIAAQINKAEMNYRVAFIFDQQKGFQGRARKLYDNVKEQFPHLAKRMGTLRYADKKDFVPLQIADKLAYEIMKNMLNMKCDPDRKERVALKFAYRFPAWCPGPDPEGHLRMQTLTGALQWNRTGGVKPWVKPRPCDPNYLVVPTSFPVLVVGFDRGLQRLLG